MASKDLKIKEIAIAGGVSANSGIRNKLIELGKKYQWNTYIPEFQYCTDNAGMIAITGHYMYKLGMFTDQTVSACARVPFQR
jgi:N6-L-threonylcarbamoyladenine synthase